MRGPLPGELDELAASIGITLDRDLLLTAMTHASFAHENPDQAPMGDNERLEFLGDAVLQFCAGQYLFRRFPAAAAGELTRLRAAAVSEEALCRVGRDLNLGDYLRLGRGENASGGRERRSLLADAFEALVGAIYLGRGVGEAKRFVERRLGPMFAALFASPPVDPKTTLQEAAQAVGRAVSYHLVAETGPDHGRVFDVEVRVGGIRAGNGRGRSKKEAEQAAAAAALADGPGVCGLR
jgi:ribonuclease-3